MAVAKIILFVSLRFLHPCFWRWKSSGTWRCAIKGCSSWCFKGTV